MKVLINGQIINYELQQEKTLKDLVLALDHWLADQGFVLLGLSIDGKVVDPELDPWQGLSLSDIKTLDIEADSQRDLRQANLNVLFEYAQNVNAAFNKLINGELNIQLLQGLLLTWPEIKKTMASLAFALPELAQTSENEISNLIDKDLENGLDEKGHIRTETIPSMAKHFHNLELIVRERLGELDDPRREAGATAILLEGFIPDLGMVSTRLMTGKEKEAYDTILRFSELLSKLLRLFWLMIEVQEPGSPPPFDRHELKEWTAASNKTLNEISAALSDQDAVLLGDLLEYELPQHIQGLIRLIPRASLEV